MGKNKGKLKPKTSGVFKVAGHKALKAKGKAKPVATNLKKINFRAKEQVIKSNEQLKSIQGLVSQQNVVTKKQNGGTTLATSNKKCAESLSIDMEGTVKDLEKLGQ